MKTFRTVLLLSLSVLFFSAEASDWVELSRFHRPYQGTEVQNWGKDWNVKTPDGKLLTSWALRIPWWKDFGSLYETYVSYQGAEPTVLKQVLIDGKDAAGLTGHNNKIIWYRFYPERVQKGDTVTVLIQFRTMPQNPVQLELSDGAKKVYRQTVDFRTLQKEDLISRISMSPDMKTVYFWLKTKQDLSVEKITFDGKNVKNVTKSGTLYGETIPFRLELNGPLKNGSRHILHLEHSKGKSTISFRAFPGNFNFAIYQGPSGQDLKAHNFDIFWSHRRQEPEQVKQYSKHGIHVISPFYDKPELYRDLPGLFADYLPDEPDIREVTKYKNIKWMGQRLGMEAPEMVRLSAAQERNTPSLISTIVVGKSNRPANFFTYRRISDLFAVEYYCISSDIQPLLCYPSARMIRIANEPLTSWFIAGCFSRPVNSKWKRFPTQSEIRYMTLSALAGGAQSMAFWMYPDGNGTRGPASNPALWNSMGLVNGEFKTAASLFAKSYPVKSSVITVPDDLLAQVLRTADDSATSVVLLNKNCRSDKNGMNIPAIPAFTASVILPENCTVNGITRLTVNGPENVTGYQQKGTVCRFPVKDLQEGAVYVLAHRRSVTEDLQKIWQQEILPNHRMAASILSEKMALQPTAASAKVPFRCEFSGITPENGKDGVKILSNGDLRFGVRWSNSKNRLKGKPVTLSLHPEKPEILQKIKLMTSTNKWYALKSVSGTVYFTDGTTHPLAKKDGYPGGWKEKGNKNFAAVWDLQSSKKMQKVEISLIPQPFYGIMIGETELIRK